ncbi:MAG: hypothetical protein O9346_17385 [Leptospiraceae bacterium]|jgi:hypothetical protein|nr:hypothetical protein [Leptospiraceae bacterium]
MEAKAPFKFTLKTQVGFEQFEIVQVGELFPIDDNFAETKNFWNGSPNYSKPTIHFITQDKPVFSLELKQTAKGFSSTAIRKGLKYGCNLNRVRNQKNRWGITVWIERLSSEKRAS